jgi:hypothetical protein
MVTLSIQLCDECAKRLLPGGSPPQNPAPTREEKYRAALERIRALPQQFSYYGADAYEAVRIAIEALRDAPGGRM